MMSNTGLSTKSEYLYAYILTHISSSGLKVWAGHEKLRILGQSGYPETTNRS